MSALEHARRALGRHPARQVDEAGAIWAAVAILLHEGETGLETLLIWRAEHAGDPWSGQMGLPGGRLDPSDPDLAATAVRETREEIGVDLTGAAPLAQLDDLHPRTRLLPPIVVRPFAFALGARPPLALGAEVREAFWVSLSQLRQPGARRETTVIARGVELVVPAYDVEGHVVWGMTERILTPLLDLVE